jgi:nicotinamide riboside kinase
MEERIKIDSLGRKPRIVVTGPESTGKTILAEDLAVYFNGIYVEEFARSYIEQLDRPYVYEDVEFIASKQLQKREELKGKTDRWIFFDTDLIITLIWFKEVFGDYPEWLEDMARNPFADLYLLCYPDLPWVKDPVRENGGERRFYLFNKYKELLELNDFSFSIIKGKGEDRFRNALEGIGDKFCLDFGHNK